jgi:hypothetical protein
MPQCSKTGHWGTPPLLDRIAARQQERENPGPPWVYTIPNNEHLVYRAKNELGVFRMEELHRFCYKFCLTFWSRGFLQYCTVLCQDDHLKFYTVFGVSPRGADSVLRDDTVEWDLACLTFSRLTVNRFGGPQTMVGTSDMVLSACPWRIAAIPPSLAWPCWWKSVCPHCDDSHGH